MFSLLILLQRWITLCILIIGGNLSTGSVGLKKILIIGGSGRVGGSALRKLNSLIVKGDFLNVEGKSSGDHDRSKHSDIRLTVIGRSDNTRKV